MEGTDSSTRRGALRRGALAAGALILGGTATSGVATAGTGEGRVGHYHLNALQGRTGDRVQDASPHGNHGVNNGATVVHDGQVGNAFAFDGGPSDGDYVAIADDDSLGVRSVTISAWVKPARQKDFEYVVDGQDHNYLLKESDGTEKPEFGVFVGGGYNRLVATTPLPIGVWTHVAGTYDQEELRLYIGGSLDGTSDDPKGPIDVSSGEARIGRYLREGPGDGYFFDGSIDEVRIYDRALDAGEIRSLASMGGRTDR